MVTGGVLRENSQLTHIVVSTLSLSHMCTLVKCSPENGATENSLGIVSRSDRREFRGKLQRIWNYTIGHGAHT